MKNRKRILGLSLALSLIVSQAAYAADIIVPPSPAGGGTAVSSQAGSGEQGTVGPGGQNAATGQSSPGNQTPASSQSSPGSQTPASSQSSSGGQTPATGQLMPAGQAAAPAQTSQAADLEEPEVKAQGAVLMDGATGKVLFGKNEDQQFYPASITKVMTALIVLERCSLSEVVTFSASATTNLEAGAVSLDITEGDQLTVEQCLYGLLLKSANEIGNGLAEHVAGSVSAFADLMNARAKELGCKNTHFANPHGLNDPNHKTTAYDMALILREALKNQTFRKIDTTRSYEFPATKKAGVRTIGIGHKMMYPSDSRYYEGIVGGKTGFTSLAGNTLVTGVERNGVQLIAVVLKSSQTHYTDTKAMLDYGFANYGILMGDAAAGVPEAAGEWRQDSQGWYYIKGDGNRASGEWQTVDGQAYWFDSNGYMAVGWRKFTNGAWYYFKPSGQMTMDQWVEDGGDWYYLGSDGVLLTNTTTPDGYTVDGNGIWIH